MSSSPTPESGAAPEPGAAPKRRYHRWKVTAQLAEEVLADRAFARRVVPEHLPSGPPPKKQESIPQVEVGTGNPARRSLLHDDRAPAWLISMIVHMGLMLLFALITFSTDTSTRDVALLMQLEAGTESAALVQVARTNQEELSREDAVPLDTPLPSEPLSDLGSMVIQVPSPSSSPLEQTTVHEAAIRSENDLMQKLLTPLSSGKLGDRSPEGRANAVSQGESSAASEESLERALRWLAEHQHNDGGWSFRLEDPNGPCHGQCDHLRENPEDAPIPRTAATGLCLLAFMGAGHTHQSGEYAETVRRGLYFLRGQANRTSRGYDLQTGSMYGQGIAALAIAEAFVLTGDEEFRELLEGTTMFCASAQHTSGGWGYLPGGPPDITLTAWQVIALKTSQQKGVSIPTEILPKANAFVLTLANETQSRFGYKTPEPKLSTTAIGLLMQLYFGILPGQTSLREGLDWIADQGPSESNVYYNYYAMLALHHSRHRERMAFARMLQEYLIKTQASGGHESGSWHFKDRYGSVGGRLYTTAMCALILETPYRYVPMHGDSGSFSL